MKNNLSLAACLVLAPLGTQAGLLKFYGNGQPAYQIGTGASLDGTYHSTGSPGKPSGTVVDTITANINIAELCIFEGATTRPPDQPKLAMNGEGSWSVTPAQALDGFACAAAKLPDLVMIKFNDDLSGLSYTLNVTPGQERSPTNDHVLTVSSLNSYQDISGCVFYGQDSRDVNEEVIISYAHPGTWAVETPQLIDSVTC